MNIISISNNKISIVFKSYHTNVVFYLYYEAKVDQKRYLLAVAYFEINLNKIKSLTVQSSSTGEGTGRAAVSYNKQSVTQLGT